MYTGPDALFILVFQLGDLASFGLLVGVATGGQPPDASTREEFTAPSGCGKSHDRIDRIDRMLCSSCSSCSSCRLPIR
jgi:hypothetical protein